MPERYYEFHNCTKNVIIRYYFYNVIARTRTENWFLHGDYKQSKQSMYINLEHFIKTNGSFIGFSCQNMT